MRRRNLFRAVAERSRQHESIGWTHTFERLHETLDVLACLQRPDVQDKRSFQVVFASKGK